MMLQKRYLISRLVALAGLSVLRSSNVNAFSSPAKGYHSKISKLITVSRPLSHEKGAIEHAVRRTTLLRSSSTSDDSSIEASTKKDLTVAAIAELIEVSFVNACMQLASGLVDILKLFIVSVKAAYEKGVGVSDLSAELERCPVQSANRPLLPEEINLRQTWTNIIYLTLARLEHPSPPSVTVTPGDTVSREARDKFDSFIETIVAARRDEGLGLDELNLQQVMGTAGMEARDDAMEVAILSHSMRLVYLTLTVLEEEGGCVADEDTPVPQPPIPGAY